MDELVEADERTFKIRFFTVPVARAAEEESPGPSGVSNRESISSTEKKRLVRLEALFLVIKIPPCYGYFVTAQYLNGHDSSVKSQ